MRRTTLRIFGGLHSRVYKVSGGAIGGRVGKARVLLLTTRGRKTGKLRTTPLLCIPDGERLVVVASNGGAPSHPGWFFNLEANPEVEVQVARESRQLRARRATVEERDRYWPQFIAVYPRYDSYRAKTSREIPLVVLEPVA